MVKNIRDNHLQNKNNVKDYIFAKIAADKTYGKKGNYHLNEYNIQYPSNALILEKEIQRPHIRIRNIKYNSKNKKESDLISINNLKEQNNENLNDKYKSKIPSCKPYNINNLDTNKNIKININIPSNNIIKKLENLNENNNTINKIDNINSSFHINNNFDININNYFFNCSFLSVMSFKEIENYLEILWNKLGVTDNYIYLFNLQKNNFNNLEEKIEFLNLEIENLKRFEDILNNLKKEIDLREKDINEIKALCEKTNMNIKEGIEENDKNIMNNFKNLIISYREHSIKVIEYYLLYKEKIIRGNIKGKFNEDYIKKNFINKNELDYLIKMKTDLKFITNLKINNQIISKDIFQSFKGDPFLTCLYNIVPISIENKQKVKYCHYYILQESLNEKNKMKRHISLSNKIIIENRNITNKNNIYEENKNNGQINDETINLKKNNFLNKLNLQKEENSKINNEENISRNENISNSLSVSNDKKNIKEISISVSPDSKISNIIQKNKEEDINTISNINNKTIENYNISYYSGTISNFITIYSEYYKKIPIEQKKIFNILENPMNYFKHNYFPKIIICNDPYSDLIKGICIYSVIFNCHNNISNQIIIEHLSAYNNEEMEIILKNIFDFLKNNNILNNSCKTNILNNEIYIDLYFYLENDKFLIDTTIRDFIKNELKFRWVKLENISEKIRFQKMKHQFPNNNQIGNEVSDNNNIEEPNEDNSKNNLCCNFSIKDNSVMKFMNKNEAGKLSNEDNINLKDIKYINPFNIIYLIKKISGEQNYSKYILNNINNFFNNNDQINIDEIFKNDKMGESQNEIIENNPFISTDLQQLINYFDNNDIEKEKNGKNEFDIKTKMNLEPLFDNCISIKYKNYYFNRIENENVKIFTEKETNQKFYFITSKNNENINLLISSNLNEQFKNKYISLQDNSNIGLKFKDIYNNFELNESNQSDENTNKYLYIPSFDINSKIKAYHKNQNQSNNEEKNIEKEEKYIMTNYDEYFKIKFFSEDLYYESNNKINSNNNFYFDKIEEDYIKDKDCIIDDNFIIFIINFDVIENIAVIPLMSLYITKDNFLSLK